MLTEAVQELGMPVMIKGCLYKAYRASTLQEATLHYHELIAEWGYPVIVQQAVAGEELNVVGLGDGQGNTIGLVAMKKMMITAVGKVWTGVTIKNGSVLEAAESSCGGADGAGPSNSNAFWLPTACICSRSTPASPPGPISPREWD